MRPEVKSFDYWFFNSNQKTTHKTLQAEACAPKSKPLIIGSLIHNQKATHKPLQAEACSTGSKERIETCKGSVIDNIGL